MLETIREYGLEQLQAAGELEATRRRHAEFFLAFAEEAEMKLRGREQVAQLALLETEHDNLRVTLDWSLEAPERAGVALRLVGALHWFWYLRDHFSEGRRWLGEALAQPVTEETLPARVKALAGEGLLAIHQDDYSAARDRLRQSVVLGRTSGDTKGMAYALLVLGWGDVLHAGHAESRSLVEESVELFREIGDAWCLATTLCTLGMVNISSGQLAAAEAAFSECLALSRALGDSWGLARALHYSGELARSRGEDELARTCYEECLCLYDGLDHRGAASIVLHNLGYVAQHQGDPRRGLACFAEALAEQASLRDRPNVGHCHCLGGVAGMVGLLGHPESAARLFGATDVLLERIGATIWSTDRVDYERNLAAVRVRLGDKPFAAAFSAGREMSLIQAIAEAAAATDEIELEAAVETTTPDAMPAVARTWGLTPRELEILRLLASRATDREIAEQLSISPRTVMHHVSHALAKLGVSSRREAAILAARHELI
jgi:DNA-binding CsgD family transcriptional regulator/Tfp pilus assembly protein PilF